MMSIRLEAEHLTKVYDAPEGGTLAALGPVSFEIAPGEFVTLVGPSGCGKSTLVRIFAGLLPPTTGEARLDGVPIREPSPAIGLMFQSANLMPWRTVLENISLPLELAGVSQREQRMAVEDLLPVLGLDGFARAYPGELSGGMAQRAALGRVLVQRPEVLLLDEPFGALDALTREKVSMDLLRIWASYRQTVLMVTHDIHEAIFLSDRVLVMSHRPGKIIGDVAVDLPRPRSLEHTYDSAFVDVVRQVRSIIDQA